MYLTRQVMRKALTPAVVGLLAASGCGGGTTSTSDDAPASSPSRVALSETSPTTTPSRPSPAGAVKLVRNYYRAIDQKTFGGAWSMLSPALQQELGNYRKWHTGYAYTTANTIVSISGTTTGPNSVSVSLRLAAEDRDACGNLVNQEFSGAWKVVRSGPDWQATEINLRKTSGASPVRDVRLCRPTKSQTNPGQICYPPIVLPAVDYPEQIVGDTVLPALHIPAKTLPAGCLDATPDFAPLNTSVLEGDYSGLDHDFSFPLSTSYWESFPASSIPDVTAPGFGEFNAAGFPKNQYVRPYVRRDGTAVSGYWRNSPADGLPSCRIISC